MPALIATRCTEAHEGVQTIRSQTSRNQPEFIAQSRNNSDCEDLAKTSLKLTRNTEALPRIIVTGGGESDIQKTA